MKRGDALPRDDDTINDQEVQKLLPTSPTTSSISVGSESGSGKASIASAYYLTIKAFVGTGILFLPRAYTHAGYVVAIFLMLFMAICTTIAINRLLKVATAVETWVYADIADQVSGKWMRRIVKVCLVLSQMGFCCSYLVFVAENVVSVLAYFNVRSAVDLIILYELILFIPLSLVRKLEIFAATSGFANLLILTSIIYIVVNSSSTIAQSDIADGVDLWNKQFPLFIGTAVFSYEGIGIILPITKTLQSPSEYPKVLRISVVIVSIAFLSVGTISYLAFGSSTNTIILLNLPQTPLTVTIQLLYSISILLSFPVMSFPILNTVTSVLPKGNYLLDGVWRVLTVGALAAIAVLGSKNLDKFVSLTGGLTCIPLTFIFPAMLSYLSKMDGKYLDITLGVMGVVLTIGVTAINILE